jgi:hypothetical protein
VSSEREAGSHYSRERLNRLREGQCERRRARGEGWRKQKRKSFERGRGWILIAGTLFHFEAPTTVTVAHAVAAGRVCQAVSLS